MADERDPVVESECATEVSFSSITSSPSHASPYRKRFDRQTRRQAWEQKLRNTPKRCDGKVTLKPRFTNTTLSAHASLDVCTQADEIDGPPECERKLPQHMEARYYRVVYRGVIALVNRPDSKSAKTGAYVSYGEIIASHHELDVEELESIVSFSSPPQARKMDGLYSPDSPPRSVLSNNAGSVSSLDTLRTGSSAGAPKTLYPITTMRQRVSKKAIRVDRVLTGGYAMDASETAVEPHLRTPKRSNVLPMVGSSPLPLPGSPTDAEETGPELGYIMSTKKNVLLIEEMRGPPIIENGKFLYQIVSSTPIQIFTGPCMDAPRTKAVLLPGTIHEVCLRLSSDTNITYLRLSHRRGWILDRKVSVSGDSIKIGLVLAVKEYVATDDTMSMTSSATPGSMMRRRHRPPRRKRDLNRGRVAESDLFSTPQKQQSRERVVSSLPEYALTPSSNVSILSEDDFSAKVMTPDRSIARSHVVQTAVEPRHCYFLMRVNAPRGLKMLDAPSFQVSNLIHGGHGKPTQQIREGQFSMTPHTTKLTQKAGNPAIFDSINRQRILPKGAVFEASRRMERSTSFSQGTGLIKLSDNSGWAIIPAREELDLQYRHYHGGAANTKERDATRAYEEIGNSMIHSDDELDCIWVRVLARQGVTVECPPPFVPLLGDGEPSPTSSAGGSSSTGLSTYGMLTSHDSDVASSVGSSFLDAMFRTPKKIDRVPEYPGKDSTRKIPHPFYATEPTSSHTNSTLACGMFFQINKWDDFEAQKAAQNMFPGITQDNVRLRGGRGWVPRSVAGKPAIDRIAAPETRLGSFWFRVLTPSGIKVRLGPSRKATSIKLDNDVYFRFECGEFLRASEVVTFFPEDSPPECFAKLYRNRHVRLHSLLSDVRQLQSMTAPAEWVQVIAENYVYMEECASEPGIQRHRGGWRYNVVCEASVPVRKGPSFSAETTGVALLAGESVLVTERVTPPGERINWLKLKDGQGWVHDTGEKNEVVMIAHSLRDRTTGLNRPQKPERQEKEEMAYNTIIARLFPGSEEERRTR